MINFRNLSKASENKAIFERNLQREREALAKVPKHNYPQRFYESLENEKKVLNEPLVAKSSKENETIIKIDSFIFSVVDNVESLDYELTLGISKIEGVAKNYYLSMGGNEERVSFNARVFVERLEAFSGLLDKIKSREPLSFSSLESSEIKKILIDKFSAKTKDWLMDSSRNITYHTKEFSISGVILG